NMSYKNPYIFIACFVLVSCLTGGPVFAGAPSLSGLKNIDEELKEAHHRRSSSCFGCHTETESPAFKEIMKRECVICHKTGWVSGKLEQLAKQEEGATSALENGPTKKASGKGPGMSVTMYYDQTRIGAEPNEMILIPEGEFIRGTDGRLPDEGPQHTMQVGSFYIDKYEVTNLQYLQSLKDTGRKPPRHFVNGHIPPGKVDHPVVFVSWYDAQAYCEWAGKRLPTDIEWEKAARGTDGRTYPWGDEFDIKYVNSPVRWVELNLIGDTTPVGAFEQGKSVYGLYDMSGNVWEWTSSRYKPYPGNTRKSELYGGNYRTLKGGSWWDCSFYQCGISAPVYNRSFFHPKTRNNSFGFRCAKDA
ncbi:MAG: formylglycine-generating enzyme family protein, partial [Gammaproteobacteria bacterium]